MSSGFRVLHLVRPFMPLLPEVKPATRKVPFREKVVYTAVALFVFLVCSQLPLFGIYSSAGADLSPYRVEAERGGSAWDPQLQRALRDSTLSCERGIGAPASARPLGLDGQED